MLTQTIVTLNIEANTVILTHGQENLLSHFAYTLHHSASAKSLRNLAQFLLINIEQKGFGRCCELAKAIDERHKAINVSSS